MNLTDLKNRQIAIVGYGMEGQAIARYLLKHNFSPALVDETPWEHWPKTTQQDIQALQVNFIFGPDAFLELKTFDIVFRSPGVALAKLKPKVNPRCVITSQTQWFFEHCRAKIIGITGTKGKGTTATLIYQILQNGQPDGAKIFLTGNIGETQPLEFLDKLTPEDFVVYELSSFQLQDLHTSPQVAVVLMVTSEHLDYHQNVSEYVKAKSSICQFQTEQDYCIVNSDFPASVKIGELSKGQKLFFSTQQANNADCFVQNDELLIPKWEAKFFTRHFLLRGKHNLQNISAAILACKCLGVSNAQISETINRFKGLEHRLEFVGEKHGIKYFNDSFSTTPETAIAAIQSFTEPLIVILGGSKKNSDFQELGKMINQSKNIKALILVGEEAKKIKDAVLVGGGEEGVLILENAKNMEEIFGQIKSVATAGDVVLLSPACASFDMFKNYKDRGEQFKQFVNHE